MHQLTLGSSYSTPDWDGPTDGSWPLVPSRAAGLDRLSAFIAKGGRDYQTHRNTDRGEGRHSHVSVLSPYLRHRMVDETEVLGQILDCFRQWVPVLTASSAARLSARAAASAGRSSLGSQPAV